MFPSCTAGQADVLPAPPAAANSSHSAEQQAEATSTASSSSSDRLQPEADEGDAVNDLGDRLQPEADDGDAVDGPADTGQTAVDAEVDAEELQRPTAAGSPLGGELQLLPCSM